MKESWKELCEIEGIKFYSTPEMGVACPVSKINRAITGEHNAITSSKICLIMNT